MDADSASRSAFTAILLALAFMLVVGATGYYYLSQNGALTRTDRLDRVVIVFASHAEDGAEVAGAIALATNGGSKVQLLDPTQKVTIPGTSYATLGDAYPFGGGKAVADILADTRALHSAFVDISEADWIALLGRAGDVTVDVPKAMEVFDGKRLVSFPEGTQTVAPSDVPALLRGAAYLDPAQRLRIVNAVGRASVAALGAEGSQTRVRTDLTAGAYANLLAGLRAR